MLAFSSDHFLFGVCLGVFYMGIDKPTSSGSVPVQLLPVSAWVRH